MKGELLYQPMALPRRALLTTLATAPTPATGLVAYGVLHERHPLSTTTLTIPFKGLPPALSGLRIGFITGVHRSNWVSSEDVQQAIAALVPHKPDLIVLGGDYVTWGDRR